MIFAGYNCKACGSKARNVEVRDRAPEEGIENYVHHIARICGEHHRRIKPWCWAASLDLLIPAPKGTDRIGQPPPPG